VRPSGTVHDMASRSGKQVDLRDSIVRAGQRPLFLRDLYALLLATRWRYLILLCAAAYALTNAVFAAIYLAIGDCIVGAEPGSFMDAFSFSVQTLATIGYGVMSPHGTWGHLLVSVESLTGLLGFAVVTGIIFSKFARPTAGVIFSRPAIIGIRNGEPHLIFRVANERGSDIIQASMHVAVLMDDVSREGQSLRRFYDLTLERSATPLLLMSWQVMHRIDDKSPLHGKTSEDFHKGNIRIMASLTGVDGTFNQVVHTYHQYAPDDIVCGAEFADVITPLPGGRFQLDLSKFDALKN
jgi:inward rectifier potassium channel